MADEKKLHRFVYEVSKNDTTVLARYSIALGMDEIAGFLSEIAFHYAKNLPETDTVTSAVIAQPLEEKPIVAFEVLPVETDKPTEPQVVNIAENNGFIQTILNCEENGFIPITALTEEEL